MPAPSRAAGEEFPDDEFSTIRDVPVFGEHHTKSQDGRDLDFGPAELKAVCDRCNRRIIETGDYAAIVIGHTPSPEEAAKGAPQPELVGLAGPFRMGVIGTGEKQRAAILTDFHIYREDLQRIRKYPRRSPELWLEDDYSEMFLDPIALLGAEAPRLDMGLLYSAMRNGRKVEKYAAAAAMPSASNVSLKHYEAGDEPASAPPAQEHQSMALTPDDMRQFVELFMATDVGQFLQKKMQEEQGTNAMVPGESEPPPEPAAPAAQAHPFDQPEPNAAAEPTDSMPPASTPPPDESKPDVPPQGAQPPKEQDAMAQPPGDEPEQYAAACSQMDGMKDEHLEKYLAGRWKNHPKHAKYAAGLCEGEANGMTDGEAKPVPGEAGGKFGNGAATDAKPSQKTVDDGHPVSAAGGVVEQYAKKIEDRLNAVVRRERYARLREVAHTRALDLGEEMDRVQDMDDRHFEDHMKVIVEHYEKIPVGYYAVPDNPSDHQAEPTNSSKGSPEKYRRETVKRAEKYCERLRSEGRSVDFGEVLEALQDGKTLPD
jgi:hypothetical protein